MLSQKIKWKVIDDRGRYSYWHLSTSCTWVHTNIRTDIHSGGGEREIRLQNYRGCQILKSALFQSWSLRRAVVWSQWRPTAQDARHQWPAKGRQQEEFICAQWMAQPLCSSQAFSWLAETCSHKGQSAILSCSVDVSLTQNRFTVTLKNI